MLWQCQIIPLTHGFLRALGKNFWQMDLKGLPSRLFVKEPASPPGRCISGIREKRICSAP